MQFFNDSTGAEYSESQFSVDKGTLQLHSITVSVYIDISGRALSIEYVVCQQCNEQQNNSI